MPKPILLITGATGSQGGATIRAVLRGWPDRWHLRALVRDPAAAKAQALAARGVELARGDLDDEASLRDALAGVHGLHSVQTPMEQGPAGEERQGRRLAILAAEAGLRHIVYSSAGGVDRNSGVPHFESKRAIETEIAATGLAATILRPAAFMENFASFAFRTTMLSMMKTYLPTSRPIQLASADDVGWFAAAAFADPDTYVGEAIEIAGDAVTRTQAAKTLRRAGRRPVVALTIPAVLRARLPEDFRLMFEWIARDGFHADIPALRRRHPGLKTLRDWAETAATRSAAA